MGGFICAVFLFSAILSGAMLYRPAEAAPVKVASWITKDKVQDRLPVRAVPTTAYRFDPSVTATLTSEAGLPWSCEVIRNAVANLTAEQISKLVRIYRLTDRQQADARKCLKEKRT